jgi:hypothetical protein
MSMKLFLWNNIDNVYDRYHSDGGVVIVADDLATARSLIPRARVRFEEGPQIIGDPDAVYEIAGDAQTAVFIFPNAGCC